MGNQMLDYNEYQMLFRNQKKRKEALKQAIDIRKFEIDMYWKRATYFLTFIVAAFAAYFIVLASKDINAARQNFMLFLIGGLGFMFSFSWYLMNKGSKFSQENWESHVDFLEDEIIGPLYKIVIERNRKMTRRRFSVSKINLTLSLFFTSIWIIIGLDILSGIFIQPGFFVNKWSYFGDNEHGLVIFVLLILLFFSARLYFYEKTSHDDNKAYIRYKKLPSEEIKENHNSEFKPRNITHSRN
jgi:NADH:ubiquinone oxidoreductase subunit 5 (subunit L)/multisubunit Na+/H+ antiporter MnhA subunit